MAGSNALQPSFAFHSPRVLAGKATQQKLKSGMPKVSMKKSESEGWMKKRFHWKIKRSQSQLANRSCCYRFNSLTIVAMVDPAAQIQLLRWNHELNQELLRHGIPVLVHREEQILGL